MSAEPVPIRRDVTPRFDVEREVIDYCALKVREFVTTQSAPPTRVVLCLMGKTGEHEQAFQTSSWDTESSRTRSEMMGHAIALLGREA